MAYTSPDVYFAADDSKKLVERLTKRAGAYRDWLTRTGREGRMRRAWSAYYGGSVDGRKDTAGLLRGGEQGELTMLSANIFGVLVRQVMRLITGQKPAFKVVAKTSDASALAQSVLGDALVEAYDKRARITEAEVDAVQAGTLLGSGFVVLSWATQMGEEIGLNPDTGKVIKEGDVTVRCVTPWEVFHDTKEQPNERTWACVRRLERRFDLIAQFPDLADKLRRATARGSMGQWDEEASLGGALRWGAPGSDTEDEDTLETWEFRHVPTPALPNGRLVRFVSSDCVLFDSSAAQMAGEVGEDGLPQEAQADAGYPYPGLLVEEYAPERRAGRLTEAHSPLWDALSLQETLDVVTVALASNANVGALVNLWAPPGSSPSIQRIDTGLNLVESPVKPEKIDTLSLPTELVGLGEVLQGWMQQIAGLNNVVMGDTPSGMPAQLAALLEAKAVQFHQQGQAGYYRLVEGVRTGVLELLQRFGNSPRTISMAGGANAWALRDWQSEDIDALDRVAVEPVNPVMRTFAGRMTLADSLAEKYPQAMPVEKYLEVWLSGELNTNMDPRKARLGRLAREREMLARGVGLPQVDMQASMQTGAPVFVEDGQEHIRPLVADKHWENIPEYLSVLESPEARQDAAVTQAVLDVVQESLRLWQTMPMDLIAVLGGQPAPSTMMGPPGMGPPPPGGGGGGGKPVAAAIAGEASPDVDMPAPPENPITGEQAGPPVQPVGV